MTNDALRDRWQAHQRLAKEFKRAQAFEKLVELFAEDIREVLSRAPQPDEPEPMVQINIGGRPFGAGRRAA